MHVLAIQLFLKFYLVSYYKKLLKKALFKHTYIFRSSVTVNSFPVILNQRCFHTGSVVTSICVNVEGRRMNSKIAKKRSEKLIFEKKSTPLF